jgi:hypothetical protein
MTTEELAELFLMSLYDMAEAAPHPYFLFSMNDFAPKMGISDMSELRKALNLLEEKGMVYLASTDAWGGVSAGITMEGSVFVEKGGDTGIIERFRRDPSSIGIVPQAAPAPLPTYAAPESSAPPGLPPQSPDSDPSEGVFDAVLSEMATAVQNDTTIELSARSDLHTDIETLRIQLLRHTKNQAVIKALLYNLSEYPSLAPLARLILRFLGARRE